MATTKNLVLPTWRRVVEQSRPSHWVRIVVMAVLAAFATLHIHPWPAAAAYALMLLAALTATLVDLVEMRLPDLITYPMGFGGVIAAATLEVCGEQWGLLRAVIGGVVYGGLLLVMGLLDDRAVSLGDIKLCAALGIWLTGLSWGALLIGATAGLALLVAEGLLRKFVVVGPARAFAAGPALVCGAMFGLLLTQVGL